MLLSKTVPLIDTSEKEVSAMQYTAKDYSKLIGMGGFSETLLKNHFTLYQGYVTNTNKVMDILNQMLKDGKTGTPEYAELKRRFGWEFNGMRLHEYYFENLGGKDGINREGKFAYILTFFSITLMVFGYFFSHNTRQ